MTRKIMLIRHGEKPDHYGREHGLDEHGIEDSRGLTVRGWQRAGALVRYFAPLQGCFRHPELDKPSAIFAVKPNTSSQRPLLTAQPLARELGLSIDARFASEEITPLLTAVALVDGPVLLSWRHSNMVDIARQLCPEQKPAREWNVDCFDQIWAFTEDAGRWTMVCIPQQLLPGDSSIAQQPTIGTSEILI
ncbi:MAG: hypothetical protein ABIR27_04315 [Dokdonella sp.]